MKILVGKNMEVKEKFYEDELEAITKAGIYKSKSEVISHALDVLLAVRPELRIEMAVELYKADKITLSKAAEIAGISLPHFKEILAKKNIQIVIPEESKKEIEKSIEIIKRLRQGK
jgi:predicted HTH domain antitoxin